MSRLYVVVVKRFRFFFFAYHSIFNRHLDFGYKLNQVTIRSRYMTRIKKKNESKIQSSYVNRTNECKDQRSYRFFFSSSSSSFSSFLFTFIYTYMYVCASIK